SRPAVVAVAEGYGPDWAEIEEAGNGTELSLKLVEDLPVKGRILDQDRHPVAGAQVMVLDVSSDSAEAVTRFLEGKGEPWYPKTWRGPFPERPASAPTDADGRFRLTGLGRARFVGLALDGPTIRYTVLGVATRPVKPTRAVGIIDGATFEYLASPSRSIRGVIRDKATGKPIAGVRMCAQQTNPPTYTDEDGRFEILGCPRVQQLYCVMAQPQTGQPYFAAST